MQTEEWTRGMGQVAGWTVLLLPLLRPGGGQNACLLAWLVSWTRAWVWGRVLATLLDRGKCWARKVCTLLGVTAAYVLALSAFSFAARAV